MVTKDVYQKVESDSMIAESKVREYEFAIVNAKDKLKEAIEILDRLDVKIKF